MYNILVLVCNAASIAALPSEIRCSERKLAVIFFMGAMTLLTDFHGIYVAATDQKKLAAYVDDIDTCSAWDYFAARIRSVDNYLAGNIYGATELGYFNSSFQYALGKRMINTGASPVSYTHLRAHET